MDDSTQAEHPDPDLHPGTAVRVRGGDPLGHHRVPRYLRGCVGEVVSVQGHWPIPTLVLDHGDRTAHTTLSVAFDAIDVFGAGTHRVLADLWQRDLEVVDA